MIWINKEVNKKFRPKMPPSHMVQISRSNIKKYILYIPRKPKMSNTNLCFIILVYFLSIHNSHIM
jgi:hypothetical protein